MTLDEVNTLLEGLNKGYGNAYSGPEQAVIAKIYYEVLGRVMPDRRCSNRWHDAVIEIKIYIKKHGKMKEKSTYKLRPGVILQIAGSSQVYTNDNLTDEIAARYLKENPNAVMRFEIIPTEASGANSADDSAEKLLAAANARIAELEAEKIAQGSEITTLLARIAELEAGKSGVSDEDAATNPQSGSDDGNSDEQMEVNEAVRLAIAAELEAGKSKTAVKAEFAGREIDGVKLTPRLVGVYIKIITDAKK